MDDVSEFGFIFNVKGNAERAMKRMVGFAKSLTAESARSRNALRAPRDELGRFVKQGRGGMTDFAGSIGMVSSALSSASSELSGFAGQAREFLFGFVQGGINTAAAIEESNARLAFGLSRLGLDYDTIAQKVDEVSLKTVLTRADLQDMVSELAVQKINAFDDALDALQYTATDGSKKTITAVEAIADAVAFSGKNVNRVMWSIKETVSEGKIRPGRFLADDLNLSRDEVKKWNKELNKAKGNQARFNKLMELMADRVGGATGSLGDTLNFTMQQIDDWTDKMSSEAFKGVLPVIRDVVRDIGEWFLIVTKEGYMDSIQKAFTELAQQAAAVARWLFNAATVLFEFARANPWVIKLVTYLSTAVLVLLSLFAAFASVLAVVSAFQALMAVLPAIVAAVQAAFVSMFTVLIPWLLSTGLLIGAIVLVGGAMMKMLLGGKDLADTWGRFKLVLSAIWEGIRGMNGDTATLSKKTAMALQKAGLLDMVWNFLRLINRLRNMARAFYETVMSYWPAIREAGVRIWTSIQHAVQSFGRIFGIQQNSMREGAGTTMESWADTGIVLAEVFANVVLFLVMIVEWVAKAVESLAGLYEKATQVGEAMGDWAADTFNVGVQEEDKVAVRGAPGFRKDGELPANLRSSNKRGAPGFLSEGGDAGIVTTHENIAAKRQKDLAESMANLNDLQKERAAFLVAEREKAASKGADQTVAGIDKKLVQEFGAVVAKELRRNPPKVHVDGKALADELGEKALEGREDAS